MKSTLGHGLARGLTNYGDLEFSLYLRRAFASSMGYSRDMLDRPIVGICYAGGGFNNCHRHVPELVAAVERGVLAEGALPVAFPTITLGEVYLSPTSLKYRNLMSMDVEEMLRAQPMDAVVLVGGCDKTVPAQLMGAASADIPAVQLVTGPMMTARYQGERLGACTDCRRFWARRRAGGLDDVEISAVEQRLATTAGTCAVMGTASTMAIMAEVLGMMPPGSAAVPAPDAQRLRIAEESGRIAAGLIRRPLTPSQVMTPQAFENALRVLLAIGGSTNAIIHLTAIAGRLGVRVDLRRLNELSDTTPLLVDLKPTGSHYMEDFAAAGGVPAVLREIRHLLHLDCMGVTGESLGERIAATSPWSDASIIRHAGKPLGTVGGLVALFGNLAPRGAILKRAAADPSLFERRARCIVFESPQDMAARIDDPNLDVTPDDALVLTNAGPTSCSAMPEAGYIPIPRKLAAQGIKDMIRISDARMSGTAFGTVVLHVTPDSSSGGPLSRVRTGDEIELSVVQRRLNLLVPDDVLERRAPMLQPIREVARRGHDWLHGQFVTQADEGCDFSFLRRDGVQWNAQLPSAGTDYLDSETAA